MATKVKKSRYSTHMHDSPRPMRTKSSQKKSKPHKRSRHTLQGSESKSESNFRPATQSSSQLSPVYPPCPEERVTVSSVPHPIQNGNWISSLNEPSSDSDYELEDPEVNPEELINSGINTILRIYTETKPNVQEIHEKVTRIYETVEEVVVSILKTVIVQNGGSASECINIATPSKIVTFKGSLDGEKAPESCSSLPTVSPTPCSSSNKLDHVETNTQGSHSIPSRKSSLYSVETNTSGPHSRQSSSRSSVKTNLSAPHSALSDYMSLCSREDDDNETTSPTITEGSVAIAEKPVYYEVTCNDKHSQMLTLIQDDELHLMNQSYSSDNNVHRSYNLLRHHRSSPKKVNIKDVVGHDSCKLFYCKKLSLLSGHYNFALKASQLRLYHLDTEMELPSWERSSYFKFSVSEMDLKNSVPVSLENDEILLATVQNQEASCRIIIYLFESISSKASEKGWKAVCSLLKPPPIRAAKYKIQSCVVISNHIYCSLLLPKVGAFIYRFKILLLQQHQKEMFNIKQIYPDCTWSIKDPNLQKCFLASLKEDIIFITFSSTDDKTVMEVKRPIRRSVISSADYKDELPGARFVKIVAASVIHGHQNPWLAVMYHDSKIKKCRITRYLFDIAKIAK